MITHEAVGFAIVALLTSSALAVPVNRADAQRYLAAAIHLYQELEYERAQSQLERAKRVSDTVDMDVAIALCEGVVRADQMQTDLAVAAFKEGLLLKPEATLPLKVSPKVTALFEKTRADLQKQNAQKLPPMVAMDRPVSQPALVPSSNTLPQASGLTAKIEPARFPVVPTVFGAAALVAAGIGTYFGLASRNEINAGRNALFQNDVLAHQSRAQSNASAANVCFVSAGALSALGVGYWVVFR